ncbi:MFS transporter [Blastococcus sp. SYSU D00669]
MGSVDQTSVATGLATISDDLDAPLSWATWTITVYALVQVLVLPVAGRLSDQFGARRVFLVALGVFTTASLCCGTAEDIAVLVILRGVQAVGAGALMPAATGIVSDCFGRDRDRALGLFSTVFSIGAVVGPVLGGVLVDAWSWHAIFLVDVPVGLLLLAVAHRYLPAAGARAPRPFDPWGMVTLGTGLLGLMLAVGHLGSPTTTLFDLWFLLPLGVGLASLVAFAVLSARTAAPFVPPRLVVQRPFLAMNTVNFCMGVAILGFGSLLPLYAQERFELSPLGSGTLLVARALAVIAAASTAVLLLRRTGYRLPMRIGFLLAAAGLLLTALDPWELSPYAWLAVSAAVVGVGNGLAMPASNNATLHLAADDAASVAGLRGMFRQAGGITGISVASAVMARSDDVAATLAGSFAVFAALFVCAAAIVQRVPDHRGRW